MEVEKEQEITHAKQLAHQQPSDEDIKREPALAKRFIEGLELELAEYHQQPSVIRRNPNEDHRAAQPGAPTADVEIAPGRWHYRDNEAGDYAIYGETNKWFVIVPTYAQAVCIVEGHNRALAQARAPLVDLLKESREELKRLYNKTGNDCPQFFCNTPLAKRLDAALAGTGEKEALAGRTGNNKEKGE